MTSLDAAKASSPAPAVTVGQQVFFHPLKGAIHHTLPHDKILSATVASVLDDGRLNLAVLDITGASHSMTEVPLLGAGDSAPERGYYATLTAKPLSEKSVENSPLSSASKPVAS